MIGNIMDHVIVFNAGSSSLKFSIFNSNGLTLNYHGQIASILDRPRLVIHDSANKLIFERDEFDSGYQSAINVLLEWVETYCKDMVVVAAGHRVVHGGTKFTNATVVTTSVLNDIRSFIPLAPTHQPYNIAIIEALANRYPSIPQVACFDTSFHHTMSTEAEMFALPRQMHDEGIKRYGFHGLSYNYIASVLPSHLGDKATGKIIVAHLGNGASMCAIRNLKSIATTMGFSALDGLIMGTRCGNLDPGVLLYLMEEKGMPLHEVTDLLYKKSGLKGVSMMTHDMSELVKSIKQEAQQAVDLFCYQAAKQLAGLIPDLGGLDAIVFTAGIGENSCVIRQKICGHLAWLGLELDEGKNDTHKLEISTNSSKVDVYVIATDEEKIIAQQTHEITYAKPLM
jgi:acetate kinase